MNPEQNTLSVVRDVVTSALGLGSSAVELKATTPLFGSLPEFDSMAVVTVVSALESRFSITIDDSEITSELFETLSSLAFFVELKLRDRRKSSHSAQPMP